MRGEGPEQGSKKTGAERGRQGTGVLQESVSVRRLAIAVLVAFALAVVALAGVILPVEYGLDPLGTGPWFGGKAPGEGPVVAYREDTVRLEVPAGGWIEYKLFVQEGDAFDYRWESDRILVYDFHGEVEGDTSGAFTSHATGSSGFEDDSLTAPFTGTHGWYWENRGEEPVFVELGTKGVYAVVGLME